MKDLSTMTTGALRSRCETRANKDDETLELARRGFNLRWVGGMFNPKLLLFDTDDAGARVLRYGVPTRTRDGALPAVLAASSSDCYRLRCGERFPILA